MYELFRIKFAGNSGENSALHTVCVSIWQNNYAICQLLERANKHHADTLHTHTRRRQTVDNIISSLRSTLTAIMAADDAAQQRTAADHDDDDDVNMLMLLLLY